MTGVASRSVGRIRPASTADEYSRTGPSRRGLADQRGQVAGRRIGDYGPEANRAGGRGADRRRRKPAACSVSGTQASNRSGVAMPK